MGFGLTVLSLRRPPWTISPRYRPRLAHSSSSYSPNTISLSDFCDGVLGKGRKRVLVKVTDAILFVFFVIIALAAPLIDAQTCLPTSLIPDFLVELTSWYSREFGDYLVAERPHFFVGLLWLEFLFQWPLALINLYGILSAKSWFNTTCLIYGVSASTALAAILSEMIGSNKASDKLIMLHLPFLGLKRSLLIHKYIVLYINRKGRIEEFSFLAILAVIQMSNMLRNFWMQRPSSYPSRAFISLWDLFGLKLLFLRRLDPKFGLAKDEHNRAIFIASSSASRAESELMLLTQPALPSMNAASAISHFWKVLSFDSYRSSVNRFADDFSGEFVPGSVNQPEEVLLFQWPLSLLNMYAILASKSWFPTTSLIYGVSILTSTVAILSEMVRSGKASDKLLMMYWPFFGFAILATLRGLLPHSGKTPSTAAKKHALPRKKRV
ncbi:hypothetical protein F8388_015468 [Cannabis sativa]|uniref:EXPERA domain-containing protein n=1 Tax=Cannabis sativa TaxID=3483 RepID=A0A7J6GJX3_CANSA|nr:hypothetical protein F8388_015468 [Cannabis sativa]